MHHYDDHDVFVLQLSGSKAWLVGPPQHAALPLTHQPRLPVQPPDVYQPQHAASGVSHKAGAPQTAAPGQQGCAQLQCRPHTADAAAIADAADAHSDCMQAVLHAGDCLYIPRGWVHQAVAMPHAPEEGTATATEAAADATQVPEGVAGGACGDVEGSSMHLSLGVDVTVEASIQGFLHHLIAACAHRVSAGACSCSQPWDSHLPGQHSASQQTLQHAACAADMQTRVCVALLAAALLLHMRLWRRAQDRAVYRKACPLLATGRTAQLLSHAACTQLQHTCMPDAGDTPDHTAGSSAVVATQAGGSLPVTEVQQPTADDAALRQQWLACAIQELMGASVQTDTCSDQGTLSTAVSLRAPQPAAQLTAGRHSTYDDGDLHEGSRQQGLQRQVTQRSLIDSMDLSASQGDVELCSQLIMTLLSSSTAATADDCSADCAGSMQQAAQGKQAGGEPGVQQDSVQGSSTAAPEAVCGLLSLHGWLEAATYSPCCTCHSSWCHSSWLCAAAVLQHVQASSCVDGGCEAQSLQLQQQHMDSCACCAQVLFGCAAPMRGSGQDRDCGTPPRSCVGDVPVSEGSPGQRAARLQQRLQSAAMDLDGALAAVAASLRCEACRADAAAAYVHSSRSHLASCQAMRRGFLAAAALQAAGCAG
jgi:hypothetical protein